MLKTHLTRQYPSQDLRIRNTTDNSDLMFSKNLTHTFIPFKMGITLIYQNLKRQDFKTKYFQYQFNLWISTGIRKQSVLGV